MQCVSPVSASHVIPYPFGETKLLEAGTESDAAFFFCSADQGSLVTYLCISMKNPLEVYPSSRSHGSVAYSLIVKESWKDPIFHHFPLPSLQEDVACLFAFTLPDKEKFQHASTKQGIQLFFWSLDDQKQPKPSKHQ